MSSPSAEQDSAEWADPGYFAHRSRVANALRILWQMVRPPRGHRTLPTKAGLILIFISLGIGTAAFNTSHNILYITLALLLSSLLLSGVLSWLNFKGCRWRLVVEPHWRAGEPTPVVVEIANTKSWLPTYGLWFRIRAQGADQEKLIPQYGRLAAGETMRLEWLYSPLRRGIETIALQGVRSKFPFGFLRKSIDDSYAREVTVWPARIDYTFERRAARGSPQSGNWRSRAGAGAELINLREYRPGDPLRVVHWKATARRGKLLVRETAEEASATFCLVISSAAHLWLNAAQFDKLCGFAASLAEDLFIEGRLGGAVINGGPLMPVRRLADLHGLVSALAVLAPLESVGGPRSLDLPRLLVPLVFKPGSGTSVTCWNHGERIGQA